MALTTKPNISARMVDNVAPVTKTIAITPNDTNYLADADDNPIVTRGIIVGTAGTIVAEFADDEEDDLRTVNLAAGVVYPFAVVLVHTDSTALNIVGLL